MGVGRKGRNVAKLGCAGRSRLTLRATLLCLQVACTKYLMFVGAFLQPRAHARTEIHLRLVFLIFKNKIKLKNVGKFKKVYQGFEFDLRVCIRMRFEG